jgi:trigger factor
LRDAIGQQVNGQHETALRQLVKKNVLDALADGEAFDVPPSLYQQEYDSVARAMNPKAVEQHDHDHDHSAADEGMNKADKEDASNIATRRVRLGLLITEIGRENNIDVTEEDTRRAVFEEARRYPGQEQMVLEYFQKNPQAMQQIAGPIFEDKVVDFILEIAKVSDVVIDTDTLYKADEDDAALAAKSAKKPAAKKALAKKPAAKKAVEKKLAAKKPARKKTPAKK